MSPSALLQFTSTLYDSAWNTAAKSLVLRASVVNTSSVDTIWSSALLFQCTNLYPVLGVAVKVIVRP